LKVISATDGKLVLSLTGLESKERVTPAGSVPLSETDSLPDVEVDAAVMVNVGYNRVLPGLRTMLFGPVFRVNPKLCALDEVLLAVEVVDVTVDVGVEVEVELEVLIVLDELDGLGGSVDPAV